MDTGGRADINLIARACRTRAELIVGIARVSEIGRFQIAVPEDPTSAKPTSSFGVARATHCRSLMSAGC